MNFIKTETTFLTTCSSDGFMKFPNNEASIQNLPISINIKKEDSHSNDEFYDSINPSTLVNYQIDDSINIKTEPDSIQSMQYNTEIFSQPFLSKISDAENSIDLKLNQQSTSIIKHESMDIKVESHTSDSSPMTPDLETSLISIKDESYGQHENFKEASTDEYLVESRNTFCDICVKDFSSPQSLKLHCRTHMRNENYICDVCNKLFTRKYTLTRHKKMVHLKIRDWKCAHCDKSISVKSHLKFHEKTVHLKIRDWKCNHCNKSFSTKSNLISHSRVHSSDSSEVCDICNKSFRHLQNHKYLVHSERKRNFKCNHCDKAFYSKADLNRHAVIHSDARDWKCKICEKNFKLKVILQKHEKIHLTNGSYI